MPPILPPQDGFLFLDRDKFAASFAADVEAEYMLPSWPTPRCPGGSAPWPARSASRPGRSRPSWYLVATADRMIPPEAQRFMSKRAGATVVEAEGSHAIYVSKPAPVAELIQTAVAELRSAS